MTRPIFESERRCISNLLRIHWNAPLNVDLVVVVESLATPAADGDCAASNVDFEMDFVDWSSINFEFKTAASSIRPQTLGPVATLTVDKTSLAPVRHGLYLGDTIPIKYFNRYTHSVESSVRQRCGISGQICLFAANNESIRSSQPLWCELGRLARIADCAFSRVFVFGGDICFLYFPRETKPVMRGQPITLADDDEQQIVAYIDGDELVCIDGWVRAGAMAE